MASIELDAKVFPWSSVIVGLDHFTDFYGFYHLDISSDE